MKKNTFLFVLLSLVCFSCNSNGLTKETQVDTASNTSSSKPGSSATTGDNSANALDWPGTYMGTVPCADCEGIETTLTIGKDLTYTITTKYLGKKNPDVFKESGTFQWNEAGNTILLNERKSAPATYKVGENMLIQLDMEGNVITGELAAMYQLKKQ
jgi:uncharacterized lipoprotein NlpE involved in copper resistance